MKKLIIGIGFAAFMAVTGLQAGNFFNELQAIENWLEKDSAREISKQPNGSDVFTKVGKLAALKNGVEVLKHYPRINAQFQAYQETLKTKAAVTTCAQALAKLPAPARTSCTAHFKGAVANFIRTHQTGINRTIMIALLAGSIYWVYTTHPELLDTVKDHLRAAGNFFTQTIPSYASSALNTTKSFFSGLFNKEPLAPHYLNSTAVDNTICQFNEIRKCQTQTAIDAVQRTFNASAREAAAQAAQAAREAAVKAAQEAVAQARSYVSGNHTVLINANEVLKNTPSLSTSNWLTRRWNGDAIQKAYLVAKESVLKADKNLFEAFKHLNLTQNALDSLENN